MGIRRFRLFEGQQLPLPAMKVGLVGFGADATDPKVRLGVYDPERGEPVGFDVEAGDEVVVAGRRLRILEIDKGVDKSAEEGVDTAGRVRVELEVEHDSLTDPADPSPPGAQEPPRQDG